MISDSCWRWLVLSLLLALLLRTRRRYLLQHASTVNPAVIQRLRPKHTRPRSPDDCPGGPPRSRSCATTRREACAGDALARAQERRGASKPVATHGLACPNRTCG